MGALAKGNQKPHPNRRSGQAEPSAAATERDRGQRVELSV